MTEWLLMDLYSQFIHMSRYSRWSPEKKRRETWEETVQRYFDFFEWHLEENCDYILTKKLRKTLEEAVINLEVMPSMRALMSAGPALQKNNVAAYNCAFIAIDTPVALAEIIYLLMSGCGVGFSVERQYITKLPVVPDELYDSDTVIVVGDSKIEWAKSIKELIALLYMGQIPKWDLSKIRPAGAILKTFGGRASGPEPLNKLFKFCVKTFKDAVGRKLQSIEVHDLVCVAAQVVVSGGRRRSATISLSNVSDDRMRDAKSGSWWDVSPQRAMANNSACYTEKPDMGIFMKEWISLYNSKSGERGIVNVDGMKRHAKKFGRRDVEQLHGVNPCGEIGMRYSGGLCNLTEIIVRENDTKSSLCRKARLAAILGTFQSTLTGFKFLRKEWKKNAEEERLLGVSLTGIYDNKFMSTEGEDLKSFLNELREHVNSVNVEFAGALNINPSVATTTVKPSGTVSQLVDASSGIHPRYSKYYIRRVRLDKKDPLFSVMKDSGFLYEIDSTNPETIIFSFPVKAPENCKTRDVVSTKDHLELYLLYKKYWTEHNVSVTINVKENEWLDVAAWVYSHFDDICGISFLPYSDYSYVQAPYEEINKQQYDELVKNTPKEILWNNLAKYEAEDNTVAAQELACAGNQCELI